SVERIDIQQIIHDNLEKMQYMPGANLIEKNIEIQGHDDFHSDPYRLSVILNNLISNAIKYSDPHKENPFLNVKVTFAGDMMRMVFEDNGIGIDEAYVTRVFDMFF